MKFKESKESLADVLVNKKQGLAYDDKHFAVPSAHFREAQLA